MPVIEEQVQLRSYVGGDNDNAYDLGELRAIMVYGYNPNELPKTSIYEYDMMYRAGFDIGFKAGVSGSKWDDFAAVALSLTAAVAGFEFG